MIRARYGAAARQAQETCVPLGLRLIRKGGCGGAIAVLERNAEAYAGNRYPRNSAGLASPCEAAGRTAEAEYRRAYRLAVETGHGEADSDRKKTPSRAGTWSDGTTRGAGNHKGQMHGFEPIDPLRTPVDRSP